MKNRFSIIVGGITGLFLVIAVISAYFTTDAGYSYVVQDTLSGTYRVFTEPGVHFKIPFFTRVTAYKQAATINFGGEQSELSAEFTRSHPAVDVTFADTYTGQVPVTFRFRLPRTESELLKIHREFRNFDNMVDALLVKNARDVTVITATQYTGEEFFQGGVNAYKVQLNDQLTNGLYETRRQQVIIEDTEYMPVSSQNSNANQLQETRRKVWKNVILENVDGTPRRLESPLNEYGIDSTQVTLGKPEPMQGSKESGGGLAELLENKRRLVATRIAAVEQFQTAEAEARTVQQREEIEKRRQIQIAQREKELAIIERQKEVDVERQIAIKETVQREKEKDLAKIEKDKELAIAEANRDIEEANAQAAKFAAEAIKARGLAEAEVDRAKLAAKQEAADIYMAEIQRDIAQVMYPVLRDVKIDMPMYYAGGGNNETNIPNSLEVFTTLGAMKELSSKIDTPVRILAEQSKQ